MPRPKKWRCCRRYEADRVYKPQGIPLRELATTALTLDQFEALRLCDVEGLEQEAAGERLGVSRGTVQRLLYTARKLLIAAILNNEAVVINLRESESCHVDMHPHQRQCRSRRHGL